MARRPFHLAPLLALAVQPVHAAHPPAPANLATAVDRHFAARWDRDHVRPAPPADDATFLRRVYLDVTGCIPTVAEVRAFLADSAPDRRDRLIDRLVEHPGYAAHFARVWRLRWLPSATASLDDVAGAVDEWLRPRLRANVRYDRLVRTLLGDVANGGSAGERRARSAFLRATESNPATQAGTTARGFLGLALDCAQCHDHPSASWTQDQFWDFAANFAGPGLKAPGAARTATPKFLDGTVPPASTQAAVADWVAGTANPYFARHAVDRVWAGLFGTGLADAPDHSSLLDYLSEAFVVSGYDLKMLLRAITRTRVYQLASAAPAVGSSVPSDPRLFARAAVRPLSGDQLYDSLCVAAGFGASVPARAEFVPRFGRTDHSGPTIPEVLLLMNGDLMTAATDPARGPTLAAATAPFLDARAQVELLVLAALSRPARPDEAARLAAAVKSGGTARVFWALLNSYEFTVNH
jgi:Protein of unknown function (DUF1549)/Protein of unknown function (DUF1553)